MIEWATGAGVALGSLVTLFVHDAAHHAVAVWRGDKSPRLMRRYPPRWQGLADPLGSYVMPAVYTIATLFGTFLPPFSWTKPHVYGGRGSRRGKVDVAFAALAGPAAAAALAAILGRVAVSLTGDGSHLLEAMATTAATVAIVELLPLPGRDGARVLQLFLSPAAAMKMEELAEYHILFMLAIFLILQGVLYQMVYTSCSLLTPMPCNPLGFSLP